MKRVFKLAMLATLFQASLATAAFAEAKIGMIDMQSLYQDPKLTQGYAGRLKEFDDQYQKTRNDRLQKLEDARKKKVSEAEMTKMRESFEEELRTLENQRQELYKDLLLKFKEKIEQTAKELIKDKKFDLIVEKNLVLGGGTDITEDASKKLTELLAKEQEEANKKK